MLKDKKWTGLFFCAALLFELGMLATAQAQRGAVRFEQTQFKNMSAFYTYNEMQGRSTMVTTDSMLHTAHILFDYTLRAAELRYFNTNINLLASGMMARLSTQAQEESTRRYFMQPPPYGYLRAAAYFGVAVHLLDEKAEIPELIRPLVEKEVSEILKHDSVGMSPILGVTTDYTQYIPRGHYTRSAQFARYFRAMMWFGHAGFNLSGEKAPLVKLTTEELRANAWVAIAIARTLDATPITRSMNSPSYRQLWASIYQPTEYIIGTSDDLTPLEFGLLVDKIFGATLPGGWTTDVQQKTDALIKLAQMTRLPQIFSDIISKQETAPPLSVRFMGQRFTPDSFIFQQVVDPTIRGRLFPSGLDIMALLGSDRAEYWLRKNMTPMQYTAYQRQLGDMHKKIAAYTVQQWRQTAYLRWLNVLRTALNEHVSVAGQRKYPSWWSSSVWQDKQLNTALGSWAELRHDTILYVKQSYATLLMAKPTRKKALLYVEPAPEVYDGIAGMMNALRDTLTHQGVFPAEMKQNYEQFATLLQQLKVCSLAELDPHASAMIRQDAAKYVERLRSLGTLLKGIETFPQTLSSDEGQELVMSSAVNEQMALIADVHTASTDRKVLEVGVGNVAAVMVPLSSGGSVVQVYGPIFSYYEFSWPMTKRLTDEAWQTMLTARTTPPPFLRPSPK